MQHPIAAAYFAANYDFSTYSKGKLPAKLCEKVRHFLGKTAPMVFEDGLTKSADFWCHADRIEQDWTIIDDVYVRDCYRLELLDLSTFVNVVDVGAHIGTFARLMKKINPASRIVCLDVAPENIEPLRRNVNGLAEVVHACVVGEKTGPVKLLNTFTEATISRSTGGSTVIPADGKTPLDPQYRTEQVTCERITLRQIMDRFQMTHIDLLKLDCEGSEFEILKDAPLERTRFIVGEYHGFARWEEFRARVFPGWDYGHMSRKGDFGTFHLRNPAFEPHAFVQTDTPAKSEPIAVPAVRDRLATTADRTTMKSCSDIDTVNIW